MSKPNHPPNSICPYLSEIAERLWSGHAAIMVGAGFSRNARPNSKSCSGFPDWHQLGDLFYEKTNGGKSDTKGKYLNVLKLADEMQAALGRPALDQTLREAIPDSDYEPSSLHIKLLNLPWADVFTTNYDTLLERACKSVTSEKYDVVINKEDLVYSKKPRIIKLHGSFPSERPFIITEEDYRRYPTDFAPFVNTVQQALLENTLCLIGFSGDDPNFLQWIGWIRDNLGCHNSPKIYLVGVLNLSVAQKKLLEQRNIVLVDMSEFDGVEGDHYKGMEHFLDYLMSKKVEGNRLGWPEKMSDYHPDSSGDKVAQIKKILCVWKKQRLHYPGWVIVPEDRRSSLWIYTQYWINFVTTRDSLPRFVDLEFAFELNWRMEKCLCPIQNDQIEFIEEVLGKYLPLVYTEAMIEESPLKSREINGQEADRNEICQMSIHLLLSVMRLYREEGLLEKWEETNTKIVSLFASLSPEHKACLYYERAFFALFRLDVLELKNILREWQVNESLPFWEAKRAGLLAEIGQVNEAEQILEQSLKNIRAKSNLKPITTDYSLVSQEAIVILLLQYVKVSAKATKIKLPKDQGIQSEFTERWNVIKQYKCDPWNELKIFAGSLSHLPVAKLDVTEKREFDIGRVTLTGHFSAWDCEALTAYNFLRFCEDAGIPFSIPCSSFEKKSAEGSLFRIANHSPYWAMATMVRIGDVKVVEHIFNRESLSRMDVATIDNLVEEYLDSLEKSEEDIRAGKRFFSDNFGVVLAKVIPEILSRLCCKCSSEPKERLINFLLKIYKSDYRGNYGEILHLTKRLINSFPLHQQFYLIPSLLDFPILGNLDFIEKEMFVNPFRVIDLDVNLTETWDKPVIPVEKINALLNEALFAKANAREWAICTLSSLHELRLLEQEQIDGFADALWSQLDDYGLPSETGLYKFSFLNLPHPANVDPTSQFKNYVQKDHFPLQKNRVEKNVEFTRGNVPLCREIIGAQKFLQWSHADIKSIFDRLVEWWDADKNHLEREDSSTVFGSIVEEFKDRFAELVDVLVFVIAPNFDLITENENKSELLRLIHELQGHGLPTLKLESACLHIFPEFGDGILDKIENGLASDNLDRVRDSLGATLAIVERSKPDRGDNDLWRIASLLGDMVLWRKKIGLQSALNTLKELLVKQPSLYTVELEKQILVGLQYIAIETAMDMDGLEFSEKLAIRHKAAGVAYLLSTLYNKQDRPTPAVITKWMDICHSDFEFSEIKNQWLLES